jgi:hypothetical protein
MFNVGIGNISCFEDGLNTELLAAFDTCTARM